MDKVELFKLKKMIKYAYNNSPFYYELFTKHNLKPSDIKKIDDMAKIPQTTAEDLQKNTKKFFSVSEEQFSKVFTTSGTTGKPKKAYFTKKDLMKIINSTATGLKIMNNITSEDVVRLSFEVGYGIEIWGNRYVLDQAYQKIGALTIATGRLSIEEELEMIKEYKPTILMDVTSRINYITRNLSQICDLKKLGVKKIMTGAEPTPSAIRRYIEDSWGCDVIVGYGTTEIGLLMAGECDKKQGMHLNELNFLTEVVDPETGRQLPDGDIGELIFTTFDREGMPLIRYNSHDLGRIIPGICSCGIPLKRIEIKGRTDDLIPIGAGDNLFTARFDDVLFKIPEVIEYKIEFDKKQGKDLITITVESEKHSKNLEEKILKAVMSIPEIKNGVDISKTIHTPHVNIVKPNTFEKNSIKTHRLIDNRKLYD